MGRLVCCGLILIGMTGSAMAADPTGDWRVKDGVANIRVAICNERLWGVISWEKTPGGVDKDNPDRAKRTRPILSMAILLGMKKNPAKDEWDGKIYNSKDGSIWTAKVVSAKPDELEVKGCLIPGLCLGEEWNRPPATGPGSMVEGAKAPSPTGIPNPNMMAPANPKMAPVPKGTTTAKATTPPKAGAAAPAAAAVAGGDIGDVCALPEVAAGGTP